jgi:hypothetical protein
VLECYVTYDLISQKLPWKECVRITQWFSSFGEANEWIYARRKQDDWKLVEVGLPEELALKYGMPYMRYHNTRGYHMRIKGQCAKCELAPSDLSTVSSCCINAII